MTAQDKEDLNILRLISDAALSGQFDGFDNFDVLPHYHGRNADGSVMELGQTSKMLGTGKAIDIGSLQKKPTAPVVAQPPHPGYAYSPAVQYGYPGQPYAYQQPYAAYGGQVVYNQYG